MFERVLVPVDGSATSERAVDHALALAERFDSELDVLFVVEESLAGPLLPKGGQEAEDVLASLEATGHELAQSIAETASTRGIGAKAHVRWSDRVEEGILAHIDENAIEVIVMGTHGRSGISRFLLGSVAERVLRRAGVPVLTVPPGGES